MTDKPPTKDIDGLIPLSQFSDLGLPVYTDQGGWESAVRFDPAGILNSLGEAIDRALVTERGDMASIRFRHWMPPKKGHRKGDLVFFVASLYQIPETEQPWIHLAPNYAQSRRGVSLAS